MKRSAFRRAVARALRELPPDIGQALDNVVVVIEEFPSAGDLAAAGVEPGETLFGLYRGIPLSARDSSYSLAPPDAIVLYRRPLMATCRSDRELVHEIQRTLLHEVGHFLGLDDEALSVLEERRC